MLNLFRSPSPSGISKNNNVSLGPLRHGGYVYSGRHYAFLLSEGLPKDNATLFALSQAFGLLERSRRSYPGHCLMLSFYQKLGGWGHYSNAHYFPFGALLYVTRQKRSCRHTTMGIDPKDSCTVWVDVLGLLVYSVLNLKPVSWCGSQICSANWPANRSPIQQQQWNSPKSQKNQIPRRSSRTKKKYF